MSKEEIKKLFKEKYPSSVRCGSYKFEHGLFESGFIDGFIEAQKHYTSIIPGVSIADTKKSILESNTWLKDE